MHTSLYTAFSGDRDLDDGRTLNDRTDVARRRRHDAGRAEEVGGHPLGRAGADLDSGVQRVHVRRAVRLKVEVGGREL